MHPQPGARWGSKVAHQYSQRRHRNHPAFPTQWLERFPSRSCDEFLFATVALQIEWLRVPGWAAKTSARLSISNGCQDHTTSPYASMPLVLLAPITHEARKLALQSSRVHDIVASTASRTPRS
jgi:hypothetical protein